MIIKNKMNLPDIIVQVAQAYTDDYNRIIVTNKYSVTELLKPAHMVKLERLHWEERTEDVANMLYAIRGTGIHQQVSQVAKMFPERYFSEEALELRINIRNSEYTIKGKYDLYDKEIERLYDIKSGAVYGACIEPNGKPNDLIQIRIYAYMIEKLLGLNVKSAEIIRILYDWNKLDFKKKKYDNYPEYGIQNIDVPLFDSFGFTNQKIEFIINELLEKHIYNDGSMCSPAERWHKVDTWKIYILGKYNKAIKICYSEVESREYIARINTGKTYETRFIPGEDTRCINYCSVKDFCDYYKQTYGIRNKDLQNKGD